MSQLSPSELADTLYDTKMKLVFVVSALQAERLDGPGEVLANKGATSGLAILLDEVVETITAVKDSLPVSST